MDNIGIWMHPRELAFIEDHLKQFKGKPGSTMFEFGAGGSTIQFSQYFEKYYSIEHNLDWFWKIQQEIYNKEIENVELHLCDVPKGTVEVRRAFWNKYDENLIYAQENLNTSLRNFTNGMYPHDRYVWGEYIDYIDNMNIKSLDVVLIDGRARTDCAYKILKYLHEDSVVFFHDFWPRARYHKVFEYYDEIDSIKDTAQGGPGGGNTIVSLRKKK